MTMDKEHGDSRYQSRFVEDRKDGFAGYRLLRTRFGESRDVAQVTFWDAAGQFYIQTSNAERVTDLNTIVESAGHEHSYLDPKRIEQMSKSGLSTSSRARQSCCSNSVPI
jgi:hypothetical protein